MRNASRQDWRAEPKNERRAMPAFAQTLLWVLVAVGAFHAAYASANGSALIVLYLFALLQLAQADRWRKAFYPGLAVGLLIAAARLAFFWRIFSGGALALWMIYALWTGLFVALARLCLGRARWGWVLIPFVWTGLEYFRSELYYLRFSWLNIGYAFAGAPWQGALRLTGVSRYPMKKRVPHFNPSKKRSEPIPEMIPTTIAMKMVQWR